MVKTTFTIQPTPCQRVDRLRATETGPLDLLTTITKYWGSDRLCHHIAPITMLYALREALCLVREEGLEPHDGAAIGR